MICQWRTDQSMIRLRQIIYLRHTDRKSRHFAITDYLAITENRCKENKNYRREQKGGKRGSFKITNKAKPQAKYYAEVDAHLEVDVSARPNF